MGKIFATCGHEIPSLKDELNIILKTNTIDYGLEKMVKAISYVVYCAECVKFAKDNNLILNTKEEIDEWLREE